MFNVEDDKLGALAGQDAVDEELDELGGAGGRADVTREANAVTTDGDPGTIGVFLVRLAFTHNAGVCNFLAAVGGDVVMLVGEEGVGARDPLAFAVWASTDALAEVTKLIGVQSVPDILV